MTFINVPNIVLSLKLIMTLSLTIALWDIISISILLRFREIVYLIQGHIA